MPGPDRVTIKQVALETGLTRYKAAKAVARLKALFVPDSLSRYDPRVIDLLNALHGRPHRELSPPEKDWLSRYLEGRS